MATSAFGARTALPSAHNGACTLPYTCRARIRLLRRCYTRQADPDDGVVLPAHIVLVSVFLPPFILFTAGQNIFRINDDAMLLVFLARLAIVLAAALRLPARGIHARSSALVSGVAFLGGLAWMDVCADEVVAIFQALGRILGFPEALLGGTIMCWAASMGDLVSMLAVVRAGYVKMAVTSCFAGPLFQLLCGLGVSLLFMNVGKGAAPVPVRAGLRDSGGSIS